MVNGNHVVLGNSVEAESPRALVRRCVVQGCTLRGEGTVSPLDGGLGAAYLAVCAAGKVGKNEKYA